MELKIKAKHLLALYTSFQLLTEGEDKYDPLTPCADAPRQPLKGFVRSWL
jgi:hypothetical protein